MFRLDMTDLNKKLKNTVAYSEGFMDGAEAGLPILLQAIGAEVVEAVGLFIDLQASGNPDALHHIYEWYQTGSSGARLFQFDYTVGANTVTFDGATTQSSSMSKTADRPFYNKADVMENGEAVTITPYGGTLAFDDGGQTVFVSKSITVKNPGGDAVVGSFQRVTDLFFGEYMTQAFLKSSGLLGALETPTAYAAMFPAGANGGGYSTGLSAGTKYITSGIGGGIA